MNLTNKHNLPQTFVNVIQRPTYSKGSSEISVTEILSPPQIVQLRRQYSDQIEVDAADQVWSLFGSAVHNILQHGKDDNHVVEERLFTQFNNWSISGQIDLQEYQTDGSVVISDYKVTSAWAVQQEKTEWIDQLNIYAWLVERVKSVPVTGLKIVGIVRDWSRREAANKETYPQAPVVVIDIPLWEGLVRENYIRDRLNMHNEANFSAVSGEMPACTSEEMWEKPTTYAVMREFGKRAKKVFLFKQEAEAYLAEQKGTHFIETREGGRTRCESFCQVAPFCEQYKTYLKENDK
jgi:hypothetical protein